MRYHTKEYYRLMMAQGASDLYEPVIDKEYSDEEIEDLYQKALDDYIDEERALYDAPPEMPVILSEDAPEEVRVMWEQMYAVSVETYENRPPFDEEEAREEFEELYQDNLEEPDEDLPDWVRETVDPRILAMYLMPEKTYLKLVDEDEVNEEKFDELDDAADEALEEIAETLSEESIDLMDKMEDLEDSYVVRTEIGDDSIVLTLTDWDDEGEETESVLGFGGVEVLENEGISAKAWLDEDGDRESDCEFLYGEVYEEDGRTEVHMLFDNNGLKYLTFRCTEVRYE
jgi:hypothetical protein